MKFKELESKINEIAEEKGYTKKESRLSNRELTSKIESIVYMLLKTAYPRLFFNGLYVTSYKGKVIIRFGRYTDVDIKIKKIKGDKEYHYGFTQYYYVNNIEIDVSNKNSSIESYHKKDLEYQKSRKEYKNKNVLKFKKFLNDKQLTYDEFMEYYNLYKDNWYEIERKLVYKESD